MPISVPPSDEKHERLHAIKKVLATDYESYGGMVSDDLRGPDCSCGCKWAEWLEGELGFDWCVCSKRDSPRAGLLTWEHQAGYHCFESE
jgi:hypothetical protein